MKRPDAQTMSYLQRMANGRRMCEIAYEDGLSYRCVNSRIDRARRLMGVDTHIAMVAIACWEGWVTRDPRKEIMIP